MFFLELISFLDDLQSTFGRQARRAYPTFLLMVGPTFVGIGAIWYFFYR